MTTNKDILTILKHCFGIEAETVKAAKPDELCRLILAAPVSLPDNRIWLEMHDLYADMQKTGIRPVVIQCGDGLHPGDLRYMASIEICDADGNRKREIYIPNPEFPFGTRERFYFKESKDAEKRNLPVALCLHLSPDSLNLDALDYEYLANGMEVRIADMKSTLVKKIGRDLDGNPRLLAIAGIRKEDGAVIDRRNGYARKLSDASLESILMSVETVFSLHKPSKR